MSFHRQTALVALCLIALAACGDRGAPPREQPKEKGAAPSPEQPRTRLIGLPNDATISVEPGSAGEKLADYLASNDPAPRSFEIGGKQFDDWSSSATPATRALLPELVQLLKSYPDVKLRLVGHSDGAGDPAANQKISEERAVVAKKMLVDGGISEERIETAGKGMTQPIANNASPEGRARNRRIELVVIAK